MKRNCYCFTLIFVLISINIGYLIAIVINSIIAGKRVSKEKFVYYLSKIATMKNIVKINHNSKLFHHFNSDGNLEGITTKYHRLLSLIIDGKCKDGYKKCGILDTMGNILCIDNNFDCPINKLIVDLYSNKDEQAYKGMKQIYNENLIYNYKFFYSNNSLDGNSMVSLLFSDDYPRYITINNFIVDKAAYKDNYGNDLNNNNNNEDNKNNNGLTLAETITNIIVSDNYVEQLIKASFTLLLLIQDADNDKEKFKKYVEEQLETKENIIDKYYLNVGENAYIKNYIGFKSLEDINKFTNFDYDIYKYNYPTKTAYYYSYANGIIHGILFIFWNLFFLTFWEKISIYSNDNVDNSNNNSTIVNINQIDNNNNNQNNNNSNNNNQNNNDKAALNNNTGDEKPKIIKEVNAKYVIAQIAFSAVFIGLNVGILSYSGWVLYKNYNNKRKLKTLDKIESDDFIKKFLDEFVKECKISSLLIPAISLLGSSIILNIIGNIILFIYLCKKT